MKRFLSISLFLLTALGAMALLAQRPSELAPKRRELDRLRAAIRASEGRLGALEGEARRSAAAMEEYRRQAAAIDTLIEALQTEEGKLAGEMIELRRAHDSLRGALGEMRDDYATMTRALLKERLIAGGGLMLMMPAEHQRQELRERLFERFARRQRREALAIEGLARSVARQDSLLRAREREQMAIIAEKRAEIDRLVALRGGEALSLARTRQEQATLRKLVERKNEEARQISSMIEAMARGQEKRAVAPAQSSRTSRQRSAPAKTKPADGKKTARAQRPVPLSFRWPTSGRRIVEAYGERSNPETGTVTINPGINIGATLGSSVTAAEGGTVSLISWLPSYGTIVIVEHRGGYRTVYGNLAAATISRGAVVDAGDRIGTVGATLGGSFLHFEVWKGQTRLNPMTVLKRG